MMNIDQSTRQNLVNSKTGSSADMGIFPLWEEDYQDLSSFCMDGYQAAFSRDELQTGHLGMKIRDTTGYMSPMDILNEELIRDQAIITGVDSSNQQINNNQTMSPVGDKQLITGGTIDEWLDQPKSSIALRTDEWIQHIDKESVNETFNPTLNLETVEFKKEPWDESLTFDKTPNESFDLLSYLCNDESVSTENTSIETQSHFPKGADLFPNADIEIKSEASEFFNDSQRIFMEIDDTPLALRRSYTKRSRKTAKSTSHQISIDVDSDSDKSSMMSYKGAREKNNEASRKSRMNKKQKETEMTIRATQLERDNVKLKLKADHLEKMVTSMRAVILQYALSKSAQYNNN